MFDFECKLPPFKAISFYKYTKYRQIVQSYQTSAIGQFKVSGVICILWRDGCKLKNQTH